MTSALELRLGDGNHWVRFDAWHMCGGLTITGGYRDGSVDGSPYTR